MESWFFGKVNKKLLKEEIDPSMVEGLKDLINSGQKYSIELAFTIIEGQGEDIGTFLKEHCGDLVQWLTLAKLPISSEGISKLFSLKRLYLSDNQLTALPDSFGNLTSLEELSLYNNKLTSLPESLANLTSLKRLYLSYNYLTSFPESLANLTSLEELSLSYNDLTSLPESLGNLTHLERLWLGGNPLSSKEKNKIKRMLPNCRIYF